MRSEHIQVSSTAKTVGQTRHTVIVKAGKYWGDGVIAGGIEVDGTQTLDAMLEIEIDLDGIAHHLGRRAVLSKGGKSVDGYVKVKAHSIKVVT